MNKMTPIALIISLFLALALLSGCATTGEAEADKSPITVVNTQEVTFARFWKKGDKVHYIVCLRARKADIVGLPLGNCWLPKHESVAAAQYNQDTGNLEGVKIILPDGTEVTLDEVLEFQPEKKTPAKKKK